MQKQLKLAQRRGIYHIMGLRVQIRMERSEFKVLTALPEHERTADCKDLDHEHFPIERTLGVRWDNETDTLGIAWRMQTRAKDVSWQ